MKVYPKNDGEVVRRVAMQLGISSDKMDNKFVMHSVSCLTTVLKLYVIYKCGMIKRNLALFICSCHFCATNNLICNLLYASTCSVGNMRTETSGTMCQVVIKNAHALRCDVEESSNLS